MSRLTLLHINIIGAVVAIIVAVALYFTIITSAQDQITKNQSENTEVVGRAVVIVPDGATPALLKVSAPPDKELESVQLAAVLHLVSEPPAVQV